MRLACGTTVFPGLVLSMAWWLLSPASLAAQPAAQLRPALQQPRQDDSAAPPTPVVTVKRVDRFLKLDCQLLDGNGQKFQANPPSLDRYGHPPHFEVYQGDRLIGSGTFAYG